MPTLDCLNLRYGSGTVAQVLLVIDARGPGNKSAAPLLTPRTGIIWRWRGLNPLSVHKANLVKSDCHGCWGNLEEIVERAELVASKSLRLGN